MDRMEQCCILVKVALCTKYEKKRIFSECMSRCFLQLKMTIHCNKFSILYARSHLLVRMQTLAKVKVKSVKFVFLRSFV